LVHTSHEVNHLQSLDLAVRVEPAAIQVLVLSISCLLSA
jgi:hypothetical protein